MMYKITKGYIKINGEKHEAGAELDLSKDLAEKLVGRGMAEQVKAKKAAPKKSTKKDEAEK